MTKVNLDTSQKTHKIPYGLHWVGDEEYAEVQRTLETGYLTMGPKVEQFENALQEYLGAKHVVAVSSCSAALHLALLAHGIGAGDEVITTVWTFVATANAILHVGAQPVFVDVEADSYNLAINDIEKKITSKTKAIIPVHFAGQPCRMNEIRNLAKKYNLLVVEDCAHAMGASDSEGMLGSRSDAACFSFHPVKNMTTAEGGAVATHSDEIAARIRALRLHGIASDFHRREKSGEVSGYPQMQYLGFKYNMTDLQAALGLHQLKKLGTFNDRRRHIADFYFSQLSNRPELILPQHSSGGHAWHLYPIRLKLELLKISRDQFMEELAKHRIITGVHYLPIHRHRYYRERLGFPKNEFPVADALYDSILSIPMYPKMTDEDAQYVSAILQCVLDENRR